MDAALADRLAPPPPRDRWRWSAYAVAVATLVLLGRQAGEDAHPVRPSARIIDFESEPTGVPRARRASVGITIGGPTEAMPSHGAITVTGVRSRHDALRVIATDGLPATITPESAISFTVEIELDCDRLPSAALRLEFAGSGHIEDATITGRTSAPPAPDVSCPR